MFKFLVVFGCCAGIAHGYSTGAPNDAGICATQMPGHGVNAQPSNIGYNITAVPANNGGYDVTVSTSRLGLTFKGFILKAIKVKAVTDAGGIFTTKDNNSKVICNGTSVTHSGIDGSLTHVTVNWQEDPRDFKIVFKATVVKEYALIYKNIFSNPV